MNLKYVRDHIALVSQEPVLFNCSIKDNISYGLENVPYEKIVDSAKKANIHEFILSLPEVIILFFVVVMNIFTLQNF